MSRPEIIQAARLFFRAGATVFGGGDPTIVILQREFSRREWLDAERFGVAFGLARITPGTNLVAFCAGAGWYLMGALGAIIAVLGLTIPSSVLVVWLTQVCEVGVRYPMARAVISATVAAAVGTMIGAALMLVRSQSQKKRWLAPTLITGGAFALSRFAGLSPLQVIGIAAVLGFFWVRP